ncbi:hypothetical protein [Desulfosediminicola flagellatus]|uniref:hypothetical protein n=1 Tax=Desulfosediminicola flagellatus TaxID=2569541 RepID=UPI0012947702|nr:hypothetical protein [Desulfosediminicola flagellatus]
MDINTGILLVLTSFAFGVYVSIKLFENSKKNEDSEKEEMNRKQRVERINKLSGRS